jgi:YidC/Oxa1 family membrane protein insertase
MNQTRLFLIFAWLMVATLLWMEWGKEKAAHTTVDTAALEWRTTPASRTSPAPSPQPATAVPAAPGSADNGHDGLVYRRRQRVEVTTDVLHVVLDGTAAAPADLLKYPSLADNGSTPVRLLADDAAHYFVARSGWTTATPRSPACMRKRSTSKARGSRSGTARPSWCRSCGQGRRRDHPSHLYLPARQLRRAGAR